MAVEWNEVAVLLIILFGYIPISTAYAKNNAIKWLFLTYSALALGAIATIIEELFLPNVWNFLEHAVGVMLAGALMLVCALQSYRRNAILKEQVKRKAVG